MGLKMRMAWLALTSLIAVPAGAEISAEDRDVLEAFYQAANGDNWRRNAGWLEAGSDPCSWYGVSCQYRHEIDRDIVRRLELPDNHLTGTLDSRIFGIVHERLDLSGNAIGGALEVLPASPEQVDLSGNRLAGSLPEESNEPAGHVSGASVGNDNWYLDLSHNEFDGEVPAGWSGPVWLSLAGNRLEGMPLSLLEGSRHPLSGRFLDLSDNRFSGGVPSAMMDADYLPHNGPGRWGGGLNLCWNDWAIPESVEFQNWLRDHHVGGAFERCLSSDRQPVDASISGSWFDPERSGEGIVLQQLDNGMVLNYFFTFDRDGQQQWFVGLEAPDGDSVSWRELLRTKGRFGSGLSEDDESRIENRGSFRIDRVGDDRLITERVYVDNLHKVCLAVYPPPLGCFGDSLSDRLEYRRLTHLAGTTCSNQDFHQDYSGAWYNPALDGEGFIIEVLPGRRALVYWYTYQPGDDGRQAWMTGTGEIKTPIVGTPPPGTPTAWIDIEPLYRPAGASFGPGFDPNDVSYDKWGELTIEFFRDGSGQVAFSSDLEGYGAGEYAIERLARPMLAECDAGDTQSR